jgi:hypothetical protein
MIHISVADSLAFMLFRIAFRVLTIQYTLKVRF